MKTKIARIEVRLTTTTKTKLKRKAQQQDATVSEIINQAINEFLDEGPTTGTVELKSTKSQQRKYTYIGLHSQIHNLLKKLSAKQGTSISALIRQAIMEFLIKKGHLSPTRK